MLRRPSGRERIALAAVLAVAALVLALPSRRSRPPIRSAAGARLFRETPALLVEPWQAAVYSVPSRALAAVIALVVGGLAAVTLARRPAGAVDGLVLLPLGASAVMLGFGFLIAFDSAAARLPLLLVARAGGPVARCGTVRRPYRRAGATVDRSSIARGCGDSRGRALASLAGGRAASRRTRTCRRRRGSRSRSRSASSAPRSSSPAPSSRRSRSRSSASSGDPEPRTRASQPRSPSSSRRIVVCAALAAERLADGRAEAL